MLNDRDLMKLACRELARVFGRKYLQEHYEGTLEGHGMIDDDTFMLFVGIKTTKDLPGHPATDKGWTVYGRVLLDAHTGALKSIDYLLE